MATLIFPLSFRLNNIRATLFCWRMTTGTHLSHHQHIMHVTTSLSINLDYWCPTSDPTKSVHLEFRPYFTTYNSSRDQFPYLPHFALGDWICFDRTAKNIAQGPYGSTRGFFKCLQPHIKTEVIKDALYFFHISHPLIAFNQNLPHP